MLLATRKGKNEEADNRGHDALSVFGRRLLSLVPMVGIGLAPRVSVSSPRGDTAIILQGRAPKL
jgi:hypothetical protein